MSDFIDKNAPKIFNTFMAIIYIACAIKWFSTDHPTFWSGAKDFMWALFPLINITYLWDWWLALFFIIVEAFK